MSGSPSSGGRGNASYGMGIPNSSFQPGTGGIGNGIPGSQYGQSSFQPGTGGMGNSLPGSSYGGVQPPSPWQMPSQAGSALMLGPQPGYDQAPPPGYQQPPSGAASLLPQQRVIQPQPGPGVMQNAPAQAGSGMRQYTPYQNQNRNSGTWGY